MNIRLEMNLQLLQSGFHHFMRSLSTKVMETYNIGITLIWMQLHVILSNAVRNFTVRNCKYLIYTKLLFLSHLLVAGCGFFETGCYIGVHILVSPSIRQQFILK